MIGPSHRAKLTCHVLVVNVASGHDPQTRRMGPPGTGGALRGAQTARRGFRSPRRRSTRRPRRLVDDLHRRRPAPGPDQPRRGLGQVDDHPDPGPTLSAGPGRDQDPIRQRALRVPRGRAGRAERRRPHRLGSSPLHAQARRHDEHPHPGRSPGWGCRRAAVPGVGRALRLRRPSPRRGPALRAEDVDFLHRQLRVSRRAQRLNGGRLDIRLPKYNSERTVHIPDALVEVLARHVE